MRRVIYLLYILVIAIVLIPKENLYYTLESMLAERHIYLSNEELSNAGFYLDSDAVDVVLDNLSVASVERIRISPWIVTNRLTLTSLFVAPDYQLFFPGKVDEAVFSYSLWDPLHIRIEARGDFGKCSGLFSVTDHRLRVVFETVPQLRNYPLLVSKLHKEKEGLVYESGF